MSAHAETESFLADIEGFLQQMVIDLTPTTTNAPGRGRPRVLPSLCLWAGLLVCVLRGFSSQLALWRLLSVHGLWSYPLFPVSDQAIYKRLAQEGPAPLQQLFEQVRRVLAERLAPVALSALAPWAPEVMVLDETQLDAIARRLPALRAVPAGDVRLLPGNLASLFDLRRQQWRRIAYSADPQQNEKVLARTMVQDLPTGSLLLADLGYFGFAWFDWLTDQQYYWISRLRTKTSYVLLHTFYQQGDTFDGLIFLGAHRADRAAHAVRLVQFRVDQTLYRYITNVCDPQQLSALQIAQLYARRWDIELAVNLVKSHLHLHMLWSAKAVVIQQQVWAVLIIAQILQALRMEVAKRAKVDPYEVSMQLLVLHLPQFAAAGRDPLRAIVEQGRFARIIRPSTRTVVGGPTIPPEAIQPPPADLSLWRLPRYAQRKCHRNDQARI